MAALDFPANPTAGQVYEGDNGVIYTYVGTAPNGHWSAFAELSSESFADIFVEVAGDNMTGDLTLGTDKITLKAADGSITAAGGNAEITSGGAFKGTSVQTPGNVNNGAIDGAMLSQSGFVYASRTGNSAVWRGYTTGISTPTTEILSDGTTYIGGTIPSAPNITLNANGSITAARNIQSGDYDKAQNDKAGVVVGASGGLFVQRSGSSNNSDTCLEIRKGNAADPTARITADGSITAAGTIGGPGWDNTVAQNNFLLAPGSINVAKDGANRESGAFTIFNGSSSTQTFRACADGTTLIGGVIPSSPNITLSTNGSGEFAGNVASGFNDGKANGVQLVSSGYLNIRNDVETNDCFSIYTGGTGAAEKRCGIKSDGSAKFASYVESSRHTGTRSFLGGELLGTSYGFLIKNDPADTVVAGIGTDGSAAFSTGMVAIGSGGNITYAAGRGNLQTNGDIVLADDGNTASAKVNIKANGSAEFAGNVTVGSYSSATVPTSAGLILGSAGVVRYSHNQNSTSNVFKITKVGVGQQIAFNGAGSAEFAGTVQQNVARSGSFEILLEKDDPTKYTSTTNEEGEQTLVYNGAVLDVKERLQKTDAALTALKSAAAAASDFAALKSAIATALADI